MSFLASTLLKDKYVADSTSSFIRPAGVNTCFNETAKDALTWSERPPTPDAQKKYRQSAVHTPGQALRHYGTADDKLHEGPFGDKTISDAGENVAHCVKSQPESELGRWKLERSEDCYARYSTSARSKLLLVLPLHEPMRIAVPRRSPWGIPWCEATKSQTASAPIGPSAW